MGNQRDPSTVQAFLLKSLEINQEAQVTAAEYRDSSLEQDLQDLGETLQKALRSVLGNLKSIKIEESFDIPQAIKTAQLIVEDPNYQHLTWFSKNGSESIFRLLADHHSVGWEQLSYPDIRKILGASNIWQVEQFCEVGLLKCLNPKNLTKDKRFAAGSLLLELSSMHSHNTTTDPQISLFELDRTDQ